MDQSQTSVERKALGRHASIGTLYDIRLDKFQETNLFSRTLPNDFFRSTDIPKRENRIITHETVGRTLTSLQIDQSLKLSILTNIVDISEFVEFNTVPTVIYYFEKTTALDEINVGINDLKDYTSAMALNDPTVTHVVTKVQWGLAIHASFTKPSSVDENVDPLLKDLFSVDSDSYKYESNWKAKLGGDLNFDRRLHTIGELKILINSIPERIGKINDGKGFPVTYTLYPLENIARNFSLTSTVSQPISEVTSMMMKNIESICDDIDIAVRQFDNFYNDIKCWETYLNHCLYAQVKDKHISLHTFRQKVMNHIQEYVKAIRYGRGAPDDLDNFMKSYQLEYGCSTKLIDEFLVKHGKVQIRLDIFKRFPPALHFQKNVIDYQSFIEKIKVKDIYILHLPVDGLKDEQMNLHKQLRFFEYLKLNLPRYRSDQSEINFTIIDYDLNKHLLKNSETPIKCCIHHIRKNMFVSRDCYAEFMGTIPAYFFDTILYWNPSLPRQKLSQWYPAFKEKYVSGEMSKAELRKELEIINPSGEASGYCDFVSHTMMEEENIVFNFYDILSALSITPLGNTYSVQRRLESIWKTFRKTSTSGVRFDQLVLFLESVRMWIPSQELTNITVVRNLLTQMFTKLGKNTDFDQLTEDEFIDCCIADRNDIGSSFAPGFNLKAWESRHYSGERLHNIPSDASWSKQANVIIEGLSNYPYGLAIDQSSGMVFVADSGKNRIVSWKPNGEGLREVVKRLNKPTNVLIEKNTNSLIITDFDAKRVIRWSSQTETIIDNIDCDGLAVDDQGNYYVTDVHKHEVRRYPEESVTWKLVAGGNEQGASLHQLNNPCYVCVDSEGAVYVSDCLNHRVVKWFPGASEGVLVAGFEGKGSKITQLDHPHCVLIDVNGSLYIADSGNNRIVRYQKNATTADIIVDRLNYPKALAFDNQNNLYVTDQSARVLRYNIVF